METATPLRILMVDDDDVDREQIRRLLDRGSLRAHLTEAEDRDAALALCKHAIFECVLLDYRLPGANGLELVDEFASDTTAVVMLTGLGNETIAVEAMKRGAQDYLVKDSLSPEALEKSILNAMEKLQLEREVREKNTKLEQLSLYDSLTKLPNRSLFLDRLEQTIRSAEREGERFTVFMMDLDRFKEINDNYGHKSGDDLLCVVADRLNETLRGSDTVARLGGDEFAALLPSIHSLEGAAVLAERVHAAVALPIAVDGDAVEIGLSVGIGLFPEHGSDAQVLMHAADMAMYAAKQTSKSFVVCEGDLKSHTSFEILLPKRLDEGLKRDEFVLHYQPKVELGTGKISGAEALVRWEQPDLGMLPPLAFIPGAERTALIRPLTMRILEKAAAQAAHWHESGLSLLMAVNLSPRLLANKTLPDEILDVWCRHGLAPASLTLEITESGMVTNAARANDTLTELVDSGVRIAIDDFGTGYTSLRFLRELPLAELKIDELFVQDLQHGTKDSSIVRSIIDLSNGLGIDVVSEGIETDQVWRELISLGCGFGQGYAIARPMPPDEFDDFLATWDGCAQSVSEPLATAGDGALPG